MMDRDARDRASTRTASTMAAAEGGSVSFTVSLSPNEQITRDGGGTGRIGERELPSLGALVAARERKQYVNREGSFVTGFDVSTEVSMSLSYYDENEKCNGIFLLLLLCRRSGKRDRREANGLA